MVTNNTGTMPLEGMEHLAVGLRKITCECGCGSEFYQAKVGRARKYLDDKHKAAAQRARKASNAQRPLIGDTIKEILDYLDGVYDADSAIEYLSHNERTALVAMHEMTSVPRSMLCKGLNELFERYCR